MIVSADATKARSGDGCVRINYMQHRRSGWDNSMLNIFQDFVRVNKRIRLLGHIANAT